jgi:predicted alpha/beta hydrolase
VTVLHGANRGWKSHAFVLEGTGGETLGVLSLLPWRQGDLALLDLPAGTYRLRDRAVAGSELFLRVAG